MDPTYQQAMISALMGQQMAAPGTMGQNATTPYGAAFMTGNQAMPAWMGSYGQAPPMQQGGMTPSNIAQAQQPYATYPSMSAA